MVTKCGSSDNRFRGLSVSLLWEEGKIPILVAMCWNRPGLRELRLVGFEVEMVWKKESIASTS